jgi:hypothetical protein
VIIKVCNNKLKALRANPRVDQHLFEFLEIPVISLFWWLPEDMFHKVLEETNDLPP